MIIYTLTGAEWGDVGYRKTDDFTDVLEHWMNEAGTHRVVIDPETGNYSEMNEDDLRMNIERCLAESVREYDLDNPGHLSRVLADRSGLSVTDHEVYVLIQEAVYRKIPS